MANITKQLARGRQLSLMSLGFFKRADPEQKTTLHLTFRLCFTACQQRSGWVEGGEAALLVLTQRRPWGPWFAVEPPGAAPSLDGLSRLELSRLRCGARVVQGCSQP